MKTMMKETVSYNFYPVEINNKVSYRNAIILDRKF